MAGQTVQYERTRAGMTVLQAAEATGTTSRLLAAMGPSPGYAASAYATSAVATPQGRGTVAPSAFTAFPLAPRPVALAASQGLPILTVLPAPGEPVPVPPGRVVDPALRVALANRGVALSNADPSIRADREAEPSDATKRGFGIATALLEDRLSLGTRDYEVQRVRLSLDPETLSGFDHGVAAFHQRRQPAPKPTDISFFSPEQTSFVSQATHNQAQRAAWVIYYATQAGRAGS